MALLTGDACTHNDHARHFVSRTDQKGLAVKDSKHFLDNRIGIRVTSKEKKQLQLDAELAGLSVSELIRRRYFGRPIVANADIIMINELRRIGGLLKLAIVESKGCYKKDVNDTILEIKNYIHRLSNDI